jgi:hypothetical protein
MTGATAAAGTTSTKRPTRVEPLRQAAHRWGDDWRQARKARVVSAPAAADGGAVDGEGREKPSSIPC